MNRSLVSIVVDRAVAYPASGPFHPDQVYPEYCHGAASLDSANRVYGMVRNLFVQLGWDAEHLGTPLWNPLGHLIRPGMRVLIKPNLVMEAHLRGGDIQCVITHASVLRPLLDYVLIALNGEGEIVVGDSPLQGSDFMGAVRETGLDRVLDFVGAQSHVPVRLQDFRQVHAEMDERHHVKAWKEVPGDSAGYAEFDLGERSALAPIGKDSAKFRVSNYRPSDTLQYHNLHSHRYVVAGSVIDADVILNVPKMKTHCKAGVTLALKNFVGTIGRKQCLAHHRHGSALRGGDEYPDVSRIKALSVRMEQTIDGNPSAWLRGPLRLAYRVNERWAKMLRVGPLRDGGWHGNDTVWRMVIDLNRIARYGRRDGTLADTPQRQILSLVDGIVAGENEGPLEPTPIGFGGLIAGLDPVAVDHVTSVLMGLDPARIALLREALNVDPWPLTSETAETLRAVCEGRVYGLAELAASPLRMDFKPAAGWVGHVERDEGGNLKPEGEG